MRTINCQNSRIEFWIFLAAGDTNSNSIEDAPAAPRNVKAATQPPDHLFQPMPDEAGKRTN